jgi:DNA-binding GntR family transcriptional regulator
MPRPPKTPAALPAQALRSVRAPGTASHPTPLTTATTGEQIAKQLGQAILQGRYAPGERVGEQAVAEMFSLSRGPVRDALRILERQGLVEIRPRRGAYVVELALNDVADIFNVRCALLSLAVRYLARNPDQSALDQVEPRLDQLRQLAAQAQPSLLDFAQATGRVAMGLLAACASAKVIQTTYRDLPHDALWRMLWITPQPPDYVRPARRADTFQDYAQLLAAIRSGQADSAEALMRKIMTDTRDEVLHYMALSHSDPVDPFRQQVY